MARKKKPLVYCECGHETENPVRISNVDATDMHVTVCFRCIGTNETREVVEMVFGPEMDERRKEWVGMSKRQREKKKIVITKQREAKEGA